jgi:ATP-dependent DNA helicase
MLPDLDLAEDVWAGAPPAATRGGSSAKRGRPTKKKSVTKPSVASRTKTKSRKATTKDDDEDSHPPNTFPVVLTTFEMIIRDRNHLGAYSWGYEGSS